MCLPDVFANPVAKKGLRYRQALRLRGGRNVAFAKGIVNDNPCFSQMADHEHVGPLAFVGEGGGFFLGNDLGASMSSARALVLVWWMRVATMR